MKCTCFVIASLLSGLPLNVPAQEKNDSGQDKAIARRVARSIELYSLYLGEWPTSLADLTRKPDNASFWPEGGFWFGPLPGEVSWNDGTVVYHGVSIKVSAPTRTAINPPTDRLKHHYNACVRLMLIRSTALAYRESHNALPKKPSDLGEFPKDPWGKPFAFKVSKTRFRIAVDDAARRQILPSDLTKEEARALEEHSFLPLGGEDRKSASTWIENLSAEDQESRKQAYESLRRLGAPSTPLLHEASKTAKDAEARGRLQDLLLHFGGRPSGWWNQLRPLSTAVPLSNAGATAEDCANNLCQLWKFTNIYMSMFGGPERKMPEATGSEFWLAPTKTNPALIDDALADEILECPISHEPFVYRGPCHDVNKLLDEDAVGMCDDEGHDDKAVILFKTGDVKVVERSDPLYKKALEKTKR